MIQDVGMVRMCCGVAPILFGWFLSVPSLHAQAYFHSENYFVTCSCCFLVELILEW